MNRRANLTALPPIPPGGRLLQRPTPAQVPPQPQTPPNARRFVIHIEGALAENGQIGYASIQTSGLTGPEAEYITHRTPFAPPAVQMAALDGQEGTAEAPAASEPPQEAEPPAERAQSDDSA